MKKRVLIILVAAFSIVMEAHAVKKAETNVDKNIETFEDAVASLDGGPFKVNGKIPYKYEAVALTGTSPEVAAQRRVRNAIRRNEYMLKSGIWPESGSGGSAQQALKELETVHKQFDDYNQRNQLDMKKLQEKTIPRYRRVHSQLNNEAKTVKTDIEDLEAKVAKGEQETKCGLFQFFGCPDNSKRLASKKAQLKLYKDRLTKLNANIGQLQNNVSIELTKQQGSLTNNDEFAEKVLKVIKNNKNFVAQEVAGLIGGTIKANADAIEKNVNELGLLKAEVNNLKNTVENSLQNLDLQQFSVQLQESLTSQMEKIKQDLLDSACDQAPSCTNRSPLEALATDNGPRNNRPLGPFDPTSPLDPAFYGGGSTAQ